MTPASFPVTRDAASSNPARIGKIDICKYACDIPAQAIWFRHKRTQIVDPLGRTTSLAYANHVDRAAISRTTAYGLQTTLSQSTYNPQHRPIFSTDAAGQTTRYTYNAAGQLASIANALGQTTSNQYDSLGRLTAIVNANNVTAKSFTYDAYDRVRTRTDSEGYTLTYDYDAADRLTKITYPDGTTDLYTYNKLDLAAHQDRQGRVWHYTYDADRRLVSILDPRGQLTRMSYNGVGELVSLTDPKGNVTGWTYDVEGRLTQKTYPDNSTVTYTYENTTSRLKSVTDALGQTKQFSYAADDSVLGVSYLNAVNPTPGVSFAYDPYFSRITSMTDASVRRNIPISASLRLAPCSGSRNASRLPAHPPAPTRSTMPMTR